MLITAPKRPGSPHLAAGGAQGMDVELGVAKTDPRAAAGSRTLFIRLRWPTAACCFVGASLAMADADAIGNILDGLGSAHVSEAGSKAPLRPRGRI